MRHTFAYSHTLFTSILQHVPVFTYPLSLDAFCTILQLPPMQMDTLSSTLHLHQTSRAHLHPYARSNPSSSPHQQTQSSPTLSPSPTRTLTPISPQSQYITNAVQVPQASNDRAETLRPSKPIACYNDDDEKPPLPTTTSSNTSDALLDFVDTTDTRDSNQTRDLEQTRDPEQTGFIR
ncbi:hypothetical protein C8R42DRAFT_722951 [Lentinula raphanica]|nr:hypothetical protein C8R42DRAFT_722951 [Lentinula raphanica]